MVFRRRRIPRAPVKRISRGQPLSMWERYLERALAEIEKGDKGNLNDALEDIDAALEIAPGVGELYATRALVLHLMGRREDEAEEFCAIALRMDKHQWMSYYVQGLIAMKAKEYEDALEHFSQAQRYVPLRPEVLQSRAMVYYAQGHIQLAVQDMQNAVDNLEKGDKRARDMKKMLSDFEKKAK